MLLWVGILAFGFVIVMLVLDQSKAKSDRERKLREIQNKIKANEERSKKNAEKLQE